MSMTFKTNLLPNDNTFSLGDSTHKWKINGVDDPKLTDTNTKQNITLATTTKTYLTGVNATNTLSGTATALEGLADTGVYLTTTAGQVNATSYKINEKVTLQYNSTTNALDFVFT